jgi:hypothetical protein
MGLTWLEPLWSPLQTFMKRTGMSLSGVIRQTDGGQTD